MTNESNKPFTKIRDAALVATIWKNSRKTGFSYSVEFSRVYTDEAGDFHESQTFSGGEILRIKRLADKAYDVIAEAKAEDKESVKE